MRLGHLMCGKSGSNAAVPPRGLSRVAHSEGLTQRAKIVEAKEVI